MFRRTPYIPANTRQRLRRTRPGALFCRQTGHGKESRRVWPTLGGVMMLALFALWGLLPRAHEMNQPQKSPRADLTSVQQPNVSAPSVEAGLALHAQAQQVYGKLPLVFEANRGQTESQVSFITRAGGATIFLTPSEAVLVMRSANSGTRTDEPSTRSLETAELRSAAKTSSAIRNLQLGVLRMRLAGANPRSAATGLNQQEGMVNYFTGNDPAQWHTNIPTFGKVRYSAVYPGVDMIYYGNQRQLECTWWSLPALMRDRSCSVLKERNV
jgi:hypothetical protein